jgi:hypothetical protein
MTFYTALNAASTAGFDLWFALLAPLPALAQIGATALPVTVFALLVFRWVSNQAGIRRAKERIKAHLLELWLYKDDPLVLLGAQGRVLWNSFVYLGHSLLPLLVMIGPVALVLVQLESRFAWRALAPGEPVLMVLTLADPAAVGSVAGEFEGDGGVRAETPALRVPDRGQVFWRLHVAAEGEAVARIAVGEVTVERRIVAGTGAGGGTVALAPVVYRADDWRILGFPADAPLPAAAAVESIEVAYPRARGEFLGLSSASWLLFGATLVLGFALRGAFGVTF